MSRWTTTTRLINVAHPVQVVPLLLGALTICAQTVYPLLGDAGQLWVTRGSVLAFAAASLTHAGRMAPRVAVICLGLGFLAEYVGHRTGFPFGSYDYTDTLGAEVGGVPIYIVCAWAMMGWPAFVAGRLVGRPVLVGTVILVGWDLFLDPQMVGDGHWVWEQTGWPTLHGIPVSNFVGWAIVGALMMLVLDRAVPVLPVATAWLGYPAMMLTWVWFSETVGFLVFFGRPEVALPASPVLAAALAFPARVWWRARTTPVLTAPMGRA
jgi:uncharacterized membrane protein